MLIKAKRLKALSTGLNLNMSDFEMIITWASLQKKLEKSDLILSLDRIEKCFLICYKTESNTIFRSESLNQISGFIHGWILSRDFKQLET